MRRTFPPALLLALFLPSLAAAASIGLVLEEDPPLPGEPLDGWEPLGPPAELSAEQVLDVDEAIALALESNPELRGAVAGVDVARGVRLDARSIANPVWDVALHERELAVGVALDVTDVVLAPVRSAAAGPTVDAARLRAADAALRLRYDVRAAYYQQQAAGMAWQASLRSVDALAASRDAARALEEAGNIAARDLALREVAYEEARVRAAELELGVVAARERLDRLIGGVAGPLSPALPAVPAELDLPEDVESAVVAANLELRAREAEVRAARRQTTLARVEGLAPEVDLFVDAERVVLPGVAEGGLTAGVGLSVPLFSFGAGDVLRSAAEADILRARLDATERDVRSATRETRARLESAHRRALHLEDVVVPARERVLAETLLHYNAMQVGIDVLLDTWRQRVEADITSAETLRELWTARAALDALLAGSSVALSGPVASSAASRINETGGH